MSTCTQVDITPLEQIARNLSQKTDIRGDELNVIDLLRKRDKDIVQALQVSRDLVQRIAELEEENSTVIATAEEINTQYEQLTQELADVREMSGRHRQERTMLQDEVGCLHETVRELEEDVVLAHQQRDRMQEQTVQPLKDRLQTILDELDMVRAQRDDDIAKARMEERTRRDTPEPEDDDSIPKQDFSQKESDTNRRLATMNTELLKEVEDLKENLAAAREELTKKERSILSLNEASDLLQAHLDEERELVRTLRAQQITATPRHILPQPTPRSARNADALFVELVDEMKRKRDVWDRDDDDTALCTPRVTDNASPVPRLALPSTTTAAPVPELIASDTSSSDRNHKLSDDQERIFSLQQDLLHEKEQSNNQQLEIEKYKQLIEEMQRSQNHLQDQLRSQQDEINALTIRLKQAMLENAKSRCCWGLC